MYIYMCIYIYIYIYIYIDGQDPTGPQWGKNLGIYSKVRSRCWFSFSLVLGVFRPEMAIGNIKNIFSANRYLFVHPK